jgi:hypothetical protein
VGGLDSSRVDCNRFAPANNLAEELCALWPARPMTTVALSGQAITVVSEGLTSVSPALAIAISSASLARTPSAGARSLRDGTSPVPFLIEVNLRHGVLSTD